MNASTFQQPVFMFSGQGAQHYHMGKDLYAQKSLFFEYLHEYDALAQNLGSHSLSAEIYHPQHQRGTPFDAIESSHGALFIFQLALARTLQAGGIQPHAVFGSSLGEFVAATCAGILSVEDGLRLVLGQAQIFARHAPPGGMLAALCAPAALPPALTAQRQAGQISIVSSTGAQICVLAFAEEARAALCQALQQAHIASQILPVRYAFHSPALDALQARLLDLFAGVRYHAPQLPFYSACRAGLVQQADAQHFWQVLRAPIQFEAAIRHLLAQPVPQSQHSPQSQQSQHSAAATLLDLSPGGALGNQYRQITPLPDIPQHSLWTPFGLNSHLPTAVHSALHTRRAHGAGELSQPNISSTNSMNIFLFPGQGSQYKGMGADLFPLFPELVAQADAILGYSIAELCLHDPARQLNQTLYTQPALYVVNAMHWLRRQQQDPSPPAFLAGHSLGEYNALLAGGAFDFGTGLRLVHKRAQLMSQAQSESGGSGGMAAVLGLEIGRIQAILREHQLEAIDLANHNTPQQLVLAGPSADLERAQAVFEAAGANFIRLNVSAPFHSRYMQAAAQAFAQFLQGTVFQPLHTPVLANISAACYPAQAPQQFAAYLARQICAPVQWSNSMRSLLGLGADVKFLELGPKDVLSKMMDKIRSQAAPLPPPVIPAPAAPATAAPVAVSAPMPAAISNPAPAPLAASPAPDLPQLPQLQATRLGSAAFRAEYGLRYAYLAGPMHSGISSPQMVANLARAGMLGFLGSRHLPLPVLAQQIADTRQLLPDGQLFGVGVAADLAQPQHDLDLIQLLLQQQVAVIEASGFIQVSPALVYYHCQGLQRQANGQILRRRRIIAKVSRLEMAELFLRPAPSQVLQQLQQQGLITPAQAELAAQLPLATDICVLADCAGHTDLGSLAALLPAVLTLRARLGAAAAGVRVGAAGGMGTPHAIASALMLGADFIETGSINQCTLEAQISEGVKDLLQTVQVQDTDYAPAGDMFELGGRVQVLKKGVFFPARAHKLYQLWRHYAALEEIDAATRSMIEEKYFRKSFTEVWRELASRGGAEVERAEQHPRHKMALIFRWYFQRSLQLPSAAGQEQRVDFQVWCGQALGAFNQWLHSEAAELQPWRRREVAVIGEKLMQASARLLAENWQKLMAGAGA